MTYCMSDIHGDYEMYRRMLEKIRLRDEDALYILGDVVDRGPEPIAVLQDMMARPNVRPLLGNHEYMAARCLRFLTKQITEESVAELSADRLMDLFHWQNEGGAPTIEGFRRLDPEGRQAVLEYLMEFELYEELEAGGEKYVLVHAGPDHFSADRPLWDYEIHELIWTRLDYSKVYYHDRFLVTGHTPVAAIPGNEHPDAIFRANRHIAIDCGCIPYGCLGAICLDTGEEFYVKRTIQAHCRD